jgi:hypothetical protein
MKRNNKVLIIIIVLLLAAAGLAIWITQQQTRTKSKAAPATTLSFAPTSITLTPSQVSYADIIMDPGQNLNQVTTATLTLLFDPTVLDKTSFSFAPKIGAPGFTTILSAPKVTCPSSSSCQLSVSLSVSNPLAVITTRTTVGTLSFQSATGVTTGTTTITFDTTNNHTAIYSLAPSDNNQNVLNISSLTPLTITVGINGSITPSPTGGVCPATQGTCQWDSTPNAVQYLYTITNQTTGQVFTNTVPASQTSIQYPATAGDSYLCSVFAINACNAQGQAGTATKQCQIPTGTPTTIPTPGITYAPSPTITPTAIPGATDTPVPTYVIPTDTPIPTQTPIPSACNINCTNTGCISGLYCINGVCRSPLCPDDSTCTCPQPTPTTPPIVYNYPTPIPTQIVYVTPRPTITYPKPTLAATGPGNTYINIGIVGGIVAIIGAILLFAL